MRAVTIHSPWFLSALLAATAAAPPAAPPQPLAVPLAHSALVTLEGAAVEDGLLLRVRASTGPAVPDVTEFTASLQGRELPVTQRADGAYLVKLPADAGAGSATLQVAVTHDGIRELLAVPLGARAVPEGTAAPPATPTGLHRQIVWWIVNIGIVLIAALVLSRRRS